MAQEACERRTAVWMLPKEVNCKMVSDMLRYRYAWSCEVDSVRQQADRCVHYWAGDLPRMSGNSATSPLNVDMLPVLHYSGGGNTNSNHAMLLRSDVEVASGEEGEVT